MKNRERKGPSRGVIQKCEPHERNPCANKFAERTRDETLHQERCASQSSMGLDEKCLWAQKYIFCYVLLSYWSQDNASAHFKMLRGTRMCGWFQSINANAEQKGFEPRRNGDSTEDLEPHSGGNGRRASANKRGSTSIRPRSWSLRDGANTRWHACSYIAWKTLRRTRMYLWVGQRTKTTVDQTGENIFEYKTEEFVPLVVCGLSSYSGTSSTSPPQDSSSTSSSPASERSDEPAPGNWRDSPKTQKQIENRDNGPRTTVCEIFQNGYRS